MRSKKYWYKNRNGTLKCFGDAFSDYNLQSFHCAQLSVVGDCNENLRKHCLKLSREKEDA